MIQEFRARRVEERRGDASLQVIVSTVIATLALCSVILYVGLREGWNDAGSGKGGTGPVTTTKDPDPWDARGLRPGDMVAPRSGLDGSADAPRLRGILVPLATAAAGTSGTARREPVTLGLSVNLPDRSEDGARTGGSDLGGPERKVPVLSGELKFPPGLKLPFLPAQIQGWGKRFQGR